MKKIDKVSEILDFPKEVLGKNPKITIIAFNEILIENFKTILEYEDFFIRVKTSIGNVNITGLGFKLEQIDDEIIHIIGKFDNIDFEINETK